MTFETLDSYSGPLAELGLEEVEPMIVEDTFENRRVLRAADYMWGPVTEDDGAVTTLIRAFTKDELTARRESVWASRKPILQDPENPWSDYIPAQDYPLDSDVPWWLKGRIRGWNEQERDGVPEDKRRPLPIRCVIIRTDGTRCWNWVSNTKETPHRCKQHRTWKQTQDHQQAGIAKVRILQAAPRSAEILEDLAENASGEAVKLKANLEILDRAGVRGGVEIDHNVHVDETDPSAVIRDRLAQLAERQEQARLASEQRERARLEIESADVVEGEVISDSE